MHAGRPHEKIAATMRKVELCIPTGDRGNECGKRLILALFLDGGFLGPWIQRSYPPEIESLREALLTHMFPALPDAETEAEAHSEAMWDSVMSQASDGEFDPADVADWAQEQGLERYLRLADVRQAMSNMGAVMLWHLLEQQMLSFHRRQVLAKGEETEALNDPKVRRKLFKLSEFENRMRDGGSSLSLVPSWEESKASFARGQLGETRGRGVCGQVTHAKAGPVFYIGHGGN